MGSSVRSSARPAAPADPVRGAAKFGAVCLSEGTVMGFMSSHHGPDDGSFDGTLPPRPGPNDGEFPRRGTPPEPPVLPPGTDIYGFKNAAGRPDDGSERVTERGKGVPIGRIEGAGAGNQNLSARLDQLSFSSKSEAVCGILMEKYIPGFKLVAGETFQIPVGPKKIDFKVNNAFVEFHPVQLRYEFTSQEAYRRFQEILGRLPCWERDGLGKLMRQEFADQYTKGRRNILNCFEHTKSCDLIVCTNEREFIERVIRRFGGKNTPSVAKLLDEFNELYSDIKRGFLYP